MCLYKHWASLMCCSNFRRVWCWGSDNYDVESDDFATRPTARGQRMTQSRALVWYAFESHQQLQYHGRRHGTRPLGVVIVKTQNNYWWSAEIVGLHCNSSLCCWIRCCTAADSIAQMCDTLNRPYRSCLRAKGTYCAGMCSPSTNFDLKFHQRK